MTDTTLPPVTWDERYFGTTPAYYNDHDLPVHHNIEGHPYFVPLDARELYPPHHHRVAAAWATNPHRDPSGRNLKDLIAAGILREGQMSKTPELIRHEIHQETLQSIHRATSSERAADEVAKRACPVCERILTPDMGPVIHRTHDGSSGLGGPGQLLSCKLCWDAQHHQLQLAYLYETNEAGVTRLDAVRDHMGLPPIAAEVIDPTPARGWRKRSR